MLIAKKGDEFYFNIYRNILEVFYLIKKINTNKYVILVKDNRDDLWELYSQERDYFTLDEVEDQIARFKEYEDYDWVSLNEMFFNEHDWRKFINNLMKKHKDKFDELCKELEK